MFPHQQNIDQSVARSREEWANEIGKKASRALIPVLAAGALLSLLVWEPWMAAAALSALIGILISHFRSKGRDKFIPWPAFAGVWLGINLAIFRTGGVYGAFDQLGLVFLFVSGTAIQTRYSLMTVFVFSIMNLLAWSAASPWAFTETVATRSLLADAATNALSLFMTYYWLSVLLKREATHVQREIARTRELQDAELQITHSSKMAEMGKLIASIAHEIAQPAQVIQNSSRLLSRIHLSSGTPTTNIHSLLRLTERSSERVVRLARSLRDFSRRSEFTLEKADLREVFLNVQFLADHDLKQRNIELEVTLPEEALQTRVDSLRLEQVLLNLVNNARDASLTAKRPRVAMKLSICGPWARIQVANNGAPIPLEAQPRVFEPYFTTKTRGSGIGLGLGICERIITQHEGRIFFSSSENAHDDSAYTTIFCVDLPQTASSPQIQSGIAAS